MKTYLWIQILMCFMVVLAKAVYLSKNKYPRVTNIKPVDEVIALLFHIGFGIWAFVVWLNY